MANTIHVDIVSNTQSLYSGEALCVFAPTTRGEIGVYPQHTALLATLKPGEVRLQLDSGEQSIYVSGGIIEVQPDAVTLFSDTAIRTKDLDEQKALIAKQRAEEIIANANSKQDLSVTRAKLLESITQLQLIARLRKK